MLSVVSFAISTQIHPLLSLGKNGWSGVASLHRIVAGHELECLAFFMETGVRLRAGHIESYDGRLCLTFLHISLK